MEEKKINHCCDLNCSNNAVFEIQDIGKNVIDNYTHSCNQHLVEMISENQSGLNLSGYDLMKQMTELKQDCKWLYDVSNIALQQSIADLDTAYKNFYKGSGFPKYKSKHKKQSFRIIRGLKVDFNGNVLSIPKVKNIKCVFDREFTDKIIQSTISKTLTNKYFISILVDTPQDLPKITDVRKDKSIGIDLGVNHFIITSEGIKVDNPRYLKESLQRLAVLQRRSFKKQKGSNNRKKANLKIARLHEKITNKRKDYIHKLTSKLVNDNQVDTFVLEDLNIKGMMRNHKLARSIQDVSWDMFVEILRYKCDWSGKNLIQIGRFEPSTKLCSNCGNKQDLKLSDRIYICNACNMEMDRDINAAINIKNIGLSGQGLSVEPLEMLPLGKSMKKEDLLKINS